MNNTCPSCGALYAVTGKDIGRKLKCKKCGSALTVTVAGLEMDEPVEAVAEVADENVEEAGAGEGEVIAVKGKKGKKDKSSSRQGGRGIAIGELLAKVGGLSTLLFGFGVFLVIFFTFMTKIGEAGTDRAYAQVQKLELEMGSKKNALNKGKSAPKEEDLKKISDDYFPKIADAQEEAAAIEISNRRGVWSDRWGTMFGFIFMAFGCIGYLRGQEPLTLRIVAGVILGFMMIIVLIVFTTSSVDKSAQRSSMPTNSGVGGMGKGGGGGIPNFP
jgi:predicted Zn finger-like uncharacterized protein